MNAAVRNLFVAGLAIGIVAFVAWPALARDTFLERIRKIYNLPRAMARCTLCHHPDDAKGEEPDQTNLNDFGKEISNLPTLKPLIEADEKHEYTEKEWLVFEEAIRSIESKDSDSDGVTNLEELSLGTFPGEKSSKPDAKKLKTFREAKAKEKTEPAKK